MKNHFNTKVGDAIDAFIRSTLAKHGPATALALTIRCDHRFAQGTIQKKLHALQAAGVVTKRVLGDARHPAWTYEIVQKASAAA